MDASGITFLVVGCQRCGTTWVDAALREHPEVYLPPQKQTYFFDRNHEKGLEWWLENFKGAEPGRHKAVGEVATGYCLVEASPRMAAAAPQARLIMTMRHPVERAYSYYLTMKDETGQLPFAEAVERDPDLLARGRYIEQIEQILRHYPRERLLLLTYDQLASNDRAYFRQILEFIGVDPEFESSQFGQIRNSAMFPRTRRALDRAGLRPVVRAVSRSPVGDMIRRARKKAKRGYSTMPAEDRARILEHFEPSTRRLEALTGWSLPGWRQ